MNICFVWAHHDMALCKLHTAKMKKEKMKLILYFHLMNFPKSVCLFSLSLPVTQIYLSIYLNVLGCVFMSDIFLTWVFSVHVSSVLLGHPRFFNQLSTGLDIIGLAGEWLTSTANTNM